MVCERRECGRGRSRWRRARRRGPHRGVGGRADAPPPRGTVRDPDDSGRRHGHRSTGSHAHDARLAPRLRPGRTAHPPRGRCELTRAAAARPPRMPASSTPPIPRRSGFLLRLAPNRLDALCDCNSWCHTVRAAGCSRYRQVLWMRWRENAQTATFSSMLRLSLSFSMICSPSLNTAPSRTSAISSCPLKRRHRCWAASSSL